MELQNDKHSLKSHLGLVMTVAATRRRTLPSPERQAGEVLEVVRQQDRG